MENDNISKDKLLRALKDAHEQIRQMEILIEEDKWLESAIRRRTHELNERVKELDCLSAISSKLAQPNLSLSKLLADIVNIIPRGWQYPKHTSAQLIVDDYECHTSNFVKTELNQSAIIFQGRKPIGKLTIYLLPAPVHDKSQPFLPQEKSLLNVIVTWIGLLIEYRKTDCINKDF